MSDFQKTSSSAMRRGLDQFVSPDAKFETNKRSGKQLIVIAWIIEIIVVLTGLFFAFYNIALALENKDEGVTATLWLRTLSGALPFIIIAIVELTKIPLAMGFYRATNRVWKTTFFIALVLLISVTFETMFGGLERNFALLTEELRESEITTTSAKAELKTKEERKNQYSQLTNIGITEEFNKEIDSQSSNKNGELSEINDAEKNELESINNQLRNYDDIIYSQSVNEIDKRINEIENNANSNYQNNIDQKKQITLDQANRINNQIERYQDNRAEELKNASGFIGGNTKGAIQSRYRKLIDEQNLQKNIIEQELSQFISNEEEKKNNLLNNNDELFQLNEERRKSIEKENGKYKDVIDQLNNEKSLIANKYKQQRQEIEDKYARDRVIIDERRNIDLEDLKNKENSIREIDDEIAVIEDEVNKENRNQRLIKQENQVYRFAKLVYGQDDIVEVTADQVKIISVIWFGSIAFITATMGVLLALAGYVLQDPAAFAKKEIELNRKGFGFFTYLIRFFRRSTIAIWKRMRIPKIKIQYVDKDVERIVEKEVIKEVKVPVDKEVVKWKTRVVQVPLYSTQPGMVDLDPEILSKTTMENSNLNPEGTNKKNKKTEDNKDKK